MQVQVGVIHTRVTTVALVQRDILVSRVNAGMDIQGSIVKVNITFLLNFGWLKSHPFAFRINFEPLKDNRNTHFINVSKARIYTILKE